MLCAVIPVVLSGWCVAAIKLVCPAGMPEDRFRANVEVLEALIHDFASENQTSVSETLSDYDRSTLVSQEPVSNPKWPHTILRGVDYIEAHLCEDQLSVAQIADHLDIHPDYLSNLFSKHTGQRITTHIAARRTERAKNLLATTRWPVKRIAAECGYANVYWFCHVFSTHAGMTPTEFRNNRANGDNPAPIEILDSFQNS